MLANQARRFGETLVDRHVLGFERDGPTVGHRVASVDDEIDEDLVELSGIAKNATDVMVEFEDDLDVFADQLTNHRLEAIDRGIDV